MTATTSHRAADTTTGVAAVCSSDETSGDHGKCQPTRKEFTAWLTASCERQGLPVVVTDSTTLAAIATLLH